MSTNPQIPPPANVIPFDKFWKWLQGHPNCILSAGTPEAILYDDEDFHWHLGVEEDDAMLVQVLRGKQLVGEVLISWKSVAYVQAEQKSEEEYLFECVIEAETDRVAAYQFTLSHGYTTEETATKGRWVH